MRFNQIYMCMPRFFDVVHYRLNAHMLMKKKVNKQLALTQWTNLLEKLINCGVEVNFSEPVKDFVDMVFTANSALVYKDKAIISKFKAEPRQGESVYHSEFFKNQNYKIFSLNNYFEGAGDALFSHSKRYLWLGHGFRTTGNAVFEIENIIASNTLRINTLQLINPSFYHLDTCFCPIDNNKLLFYEKAFDQSSLDKIYSVYKHEDCIKVGDEDANNFACNSICVKNKKKNSVIIGNKFSEQLKSQLKQHGFDTIENNMSEFLLSGGSAKCCVMDIEKR